MARGAEAMPSSRAARTRAIGAASALATLALAGCATRDFPQSSFNPHSDYAGWIQTLNVQLITWSVLIFLVVQVLLIVAVVRFRARPGAPPPKPVHGNTALEIAWTLAPAVILTLVAIPTVATIFRSQQPLRSSDLVVKAIGHQWWWEFQYPQSGVTTADELHLPVGRPVSIEIESADVIHSFWVPAMGGKRDAIPNHTALLRFTPSSSGSFPGQCMEFCGVGHANMRLTLEVEPPEAFTAWLAAQQAPPVGGAPPESVTAEAAGPGAALSPLAAEGRRYFSQGAFIGCHTIQGISSGAIGPNLTHFASRASFAGAMFERTPQNLGRWLTDPPGQKPGTRMPDLALPPDQVRALVAYLESLK